MIYVAVWTAIVMCVTKTEQTLDLCVSKML